VHGSVTGVSRIVDKHIIQLLPFTGDNESLRVTGGNAVLIPSVGYCCCDITFNSWRNGKENSI